jgi:membrane protease YdiL (CAAX protease family)
MGLLRFTGKVENIINVKDSPIGKGLRQSPQLRATTALAVTIVALAVFLTSRTGQLKLDPGRNVYLTLVIVGCLYLGFLGSYVPGAAGALGFRWVPRQGWFFWIWVSAALGVIELLLLFIWQTSSGNSLVRPEALTWPRFFSGCVTAPVHEEILYRMILCSVAISLAGSWGGIAISGVIFWFAHYVAGADSPDNLMGGFMLAWFFVKSETIILPIVLHSLSNLFLLIFAAILFAGAPQVPPVPAALKHPAEEKGIKSTSIDVVTSITFVNQSKQTTKVYWLDAEGRRKFFATLKDGDSHKIEPTYLMHAWLITDENDKAWYVYFPDAQPRTVEILGPEKQQ